MTIMKLEDQRYGFSKVAVEMVSPFSGKYHTLEMSLRFADWDAWKRGEKLVQDAFPYLTADEREFIMTGITKEEWDATFG